MSLGLPGRRVTAVAPSRVHDFQNFDVEDLPLYAESSNNLSLIIRQERIAKHPHSARPRPLQARTNLA